MLDPNEIDNGLKSHRAWKNQLKDSIELGDYDISVATISVDYECAFGRWLYGPTLSEEDKSSPEYAEVRQLHAEFHKTAARLVQLAVSGKIAEALQMFGQGSEYTLASYRFAQALKRWKKLSNQTSSRQAADSPTQAAS